MHLPPLLPGLVCGARMTREAGPNVHSHWLCHVLDGRGGLAAERNERSVWHRLIYDDAGSGARVRLETLDI
jgi:hypothetical protein